MDSIGSGEVTTVIEALGPTVRFYRLELLP
jgi:hypothetical protein